MTEEIKELTTQVEALQSKILDLCDAEVQATRIMSDEAREAVLDEIARGIEGYDTSETISSYMFGERFCIGFNQNTDRELVEVWFDAENYSKSEVWNNHLSNNLGAIGIVAELLSKLEDEEMERQKE